MDPHFRSFAIYEHCMPFNVARAYDEAQGLVHPGASGPPSATRRCGRPCRADGRSRGRAELPVQAVLYATPPELKGAAPRRWPVVVVGAGPVGLAGAIDLALHGIDVLLLDDNNVVSVGSRAICWSKRTLEILDRLGCGERMANKGVTWKVGRLYFRAREIYSFDLLPEAGHKMPAFINLQQYHAEEYLIDRAGELEDRIALRWNNRVVGLERFADHVRLAVETQMDPTRRGRVRACGRRRQERAARHDGARIRGPRLRGALPDHRRGDPVELPNERRFWFEPPFHAGQSALLHRQPDNMYRIDLQLGWDADPELEKQPERVIPRVKAVLGERTPFEIEWVSVYTFQCRRSSASCTAA